MGRVISQALAQNRRGVARPGTFAAITWPGKLLLANGFGGWYQDYNLRLLKRGQGHDPPRHEHVI
jgi:hypothetical protein